MIYSSFTSIMVTHFFIGIVVGVILLLVANWRGHERWFQFGGEAMSFGLPSRWLSWALACLMFETLSSCKSPMFYQEIALSLVEAPAMALGAFVVDRLCRWGEFEEHINRMDLKGTIRKMTASTEGDEKGGVNARPPDPRSDAPPGPTNSSGPDYKAQSERFDDLTRDH